MRVYMLVLSLVVGSQAIFKPGEAPPSDQLESDEDIFADDEVVNFKPRFTTESSVNMLPRAATGPQKCGMRQESVFFRNGGVQDIARYAEFNWAVPIFEVLWNGTEKYTSVGSLIHPQVVLTVAYYFDKKKNLNIRAGDWDITTTTEFHKVQSIYVSNVEIHPGYRAKNLKYNAALLFLASPVTPDANVGFACLPPVNAVIPSGSECIVTGWGVEQYENGTIADIMKMVEVPIVSNEDCEEALRTKVPGFTAFNMHKSWICAGGKAGKDACVRDGGGPLVCPYVNSQNQYYQAGIVSWGHKCGIEGVPGVYTNVAEVRQWIDDQMLAKGFNTDTYTA